MPTQRENIQEIRMRIAESNVEGWRVRAKAAEAKVHRLNWLLEWVNEYASFTTDEWPVWEQLQQEAEPWKYAEDAGFGL